MKYRKLIKPAVCMAVICCLVASDSTVSNAVRSISEIEAEQDSLQDEIDTLDADLYELVSQITEIETAISETEAEIEETEAALEDAKAARDSQYESMKLRIKYMYEKEDPSIFEMLVSQLVSSLTN